VLRGLRLLRTAKSFAHVANEALSGVMADAAKAERHAAALSGHTERLTVAVEQLQGSLARLTVLRSAAGEVKRAVDGLRGAVPRK
jgi:hypothetical protein